MTGLVPFWFIVIAFFWTGFFILEGFDFGVGMLHDLAGTDDAGRRAAINTIGPLWDCLLYTSPSPRDRTRSRMPSSA